MIEAPKHLIRSFLENSTTKSVAISVGMAILGFSAHTMITVHDQENLTAQHTERIKALESGQSDTHKSLEALQIDLTRVEGKIDVINQKVDDSRLVSNR